MNKTSTPINDQEFHERFPSESACLDYLYTLRWKNGYLCPHCKQKVNFWKLDDYKYKCCKCGYQSTVTTGTLFHNTHIPMLKWFNAIQYMSIRGRKTPADELKNELKLGSNRTALSMAKKIRSVMFTTKKSEINRPLKGKIDICIKEFSNTRILVAVEINDRHTGHIKLYQMPKYDRETYEKFIFSNIEPNSVLKKECGHRELPAQVTGYRYITNNIVNYKAPYANKIYEDFIKYYHKYSTQDRTCDIFKYMDKYTYHINCPTDSLNFDQILYNAVRLKTIQTLE